MFGINTYYKRRKLEIDIEIESYRQKLMKEIETLALKCAEDKGNYEHEYHQAMEILKTEIAKLEALKEIMKQDVTTYKKLLEEKNKEIARQHELNLKLADQKITIHK